MDPLVPVLCCAGLLVVSCSGVADTGSLLTLRAEPDLDRATVLAVRDINACRTETAFVPDSVGHYDGVWLTDSVPDYGGRYDAAKHTLELPPSLDGSGELECSTGDHRLRVHVDADKDALRVRVVTSCRGAAHLRLLLPVGWDGVRVTRRAASACGRRLVGSPRDRV